MYLCSEVNGSFTTTRTSKCTHNCTHNCAHRFMWEYSTPLQFVKIVSWTILLQVRTVALCVVCVCV